MEIKLKLEDHCIETAAEEKYEELAEELIKEPDEEKEEKLRFLKDFLEGADFADLRKSGFDGSEEMRVSVTREDDEFVVERQ